MADFEEVKNFLGLRTQGVNYYDDGFAYTAPVASYFANDYGLYDMAGNVSEWCEDAFFEASVPIVWDLNPTYFDENEPRKVIRGGSWKDIGYYLQTGARHWEYQDSAKSYVGFRNVLTFLGRSFCLLVLEFQYHLH